MARLGATVSAHHFLAKLDHGSAQLTPIEHAIAVYVLDGDRFANLLDLIVDRYCEVGDRICRRVSGRGWTSAWHAWDT